MTRPLPLKFVLTGETCTGKTSLQRYFVKGTFHEEKGDDPDSMETLAKLVILDDIKYSVSIVDTNGAPSHDKIRPLGYYYPPVDVFLLCYDITNRNSFDNISTKWSLETSKHSPSAKLFIVGTKLDKREKCETPVSSMEGEMMMKGVGGIGCAQVSAATGENVHELFMQLVQIAGQKYSHK